ncbi:hypothetical protein HDU97_005348 [Phlyctochytrium planicorne]|nr:hypothetical protein HDU97_005348 [Phlyctochytrium planicorne]
MKVDLVGELEKMKSDDTIKTQFNLFSKITLLTKSVYDGHFSYSPKCISTFIFDQPWSLASTGDGFIKILNVTYPNDIDHNILWEIPSKYIGYHVVSINDMDPIDYIQQYADKYSGASRSADTRFNFVLGATVLNSDGDFEYSPGLLTRTNFLGLGASPNITYELSNPSTGKKYLVGNVPIVFDNFRLTKGLRALLKAKFFGEGNDQLGLINSTDSTDILENTYKKTRGGIQSEFSGFFDVLCSPMGVTNTEVPALNVGWSPENILLLGDGYCGSSCAVMVRALRDGAKVKSMVFGGSSKKPFTPSSFEGGIVSAFTKFTARSLQVDPLDNINLPRPFKLPVDGQIPVTEGFSILGKYGLDYPVEWVPQPAEYWIPFGTGDYVWDIWTAAAAKLAEGIKKGSSGGKGQSRRR